MSQSLSQIHLDVVLKFYRTLPGLARFLFHIPRVARLSSGNPGLRCATPCGVGSTTLASIFSSLSKISRNRSPDSDAGGIHPSSPAAFLK
jgi:hypothetical protein